MRGLVHAGAEHPQSEVRFLLLSPGEPVAAGSLTFPPFFRLWVRLTYNQ